MTKHKIWKQLILIFLVGKRDLSLRFEHYAMRDDNLLGDSFIVLRISRVCDIWF